MIATAHLLSAMLFAVQPFDPPTFVAATGLFVAVALIAAFGACGYSPCRAPMGIAARSFR